jgi:hypothetical protein
MATSKDDGPLLIEGPKAATSSTETPIIDLEPAATGSAEPASQPASRWKLPACARLAAGVALAAAVGALAGAAATVALTREPPPSIVATDATRDLQNGVAQLGHELAALKAGIAVAQRAAGAQLGKLAERLDRAEKAQAEPAAKLARIQESIERLDKRQQAAASSDITGSIAAKEETRPPLAEGWRLRDFYAGRAVVESRNGTLFEIAPGSNLPGLGKVESIKRENGKVVVTARNGVIAGSFEPRRPPYFLPYRY